MAWFGKVKWLVLGQAGLCGMAVYSLLDMAWYYLTVLGMVRLEGLVRCQARALFARGKK